MRNLIIVTAVISLSLLSACSKYGGMGMTGSPIWNATATPEQKAQYQRDRVNAAKATCKSYGYSDENAMASCIQSHIASEDAARATRKARALENFKSKKTKHTQCMRMGQFVNCTTK